MRLRLFSLTPVFVLIACLNSPAGGLLEDNFNAYPGGTLDSELEWPSPIPSSDPPVFWTTTGRGMQEIADAASTGREGQVFVFSETEEGDFTSYSHVVLPTPYESPEEWELQVDFYVESLEDPGLAFTIVGLFHGSINDRGRIVSVSLSRNTRTGKIQVSVQRHLESSFFKAKLLENEWYTLTIRGNHKSYEMEVNLRGESDNLDETLFGLTYANSIGVFDTVAIGDSIPNLWTPGRKNRVLLDNLRLGAAGAP